MTNIGLMANAKTDLKTNKYYMIQLSIIEI